MRVLMTTDTVGGVWTFTQELAGGLLDRGCSVYLVSLGGTPSESQESWFNHMQQKWGANFRHEAWNTPLEWMEENVRAFYLPAAWLIRIACKWKADLLHSSQFCFGSLPPEIPRIVTAHSDVLSWADSCRDGVLEDSAWLRRYKTLVADGLRAADKVVCPSNWMAQALTRNFEVPGEVVVIPNGRSLSAPRQHCRLQAVTAGRLWDEAKNIGILRDVRSPIPIYVVGENQQGSKKAAGFLRDDRLLGSLSQENVLKLFRESAIYICTSRYEPFGLAPLEAALCGCAVIANDIPSLREVWGDGALYFRGSEALASLLRELCGSRDSLADAQRCSLLRARQYSAERMTESYVKLYRTALTKSEKTAYVA